MKKGIIFIGLLAIFTACKDKTYYEYDAYSPVYTDAEVFRGSVSFDAPRQMEEKGNIYFKSDVLFIVEPEKGIHFINNANPSAPIQTGFLNVWGATGMAIKDNYLFVNSYIDLVVFDISSMANPIEVKRLEDVFPMALPKFDGSHAIAPIDKNKGIVTSWKIEKRKDDQYNGDAQWQNCPSCDQSKLFNGNQNFQTNGFTNAVESGNSNTGGGNTGGNTGGNGIAGSISLFTIIEDYLYVIEKGSILYPIKISDPTHPIVANDVQVVNEVETLFPYKEHIFMGTPTGMFIYETSNPEIPTFISRVSHARGCDPVVVENDFAYVTVRSGGPCGSAVNQLDVIDVSNLEQPQLLATFQMENPHGLGIDGNSLFICDGEAGLKVFDATNPVESGNLLQHQFGDIQATDIIPFGNTAMVIGDDGLYQYDYSNPSEMVFLSKIEF